VWRCDYGSNFNVIWVGASAPCPPPCSLLAAPLAVYTDIQTHSLLLSSLPLLVNILNKHVIQQNDPYINVLFSCIHCTRRIGGTTGTELIEIPESIMLRRNRILHVL